MAKTTAKNATQAAETEKVIICTAEDAQAATNEKNNMISRLIKLQGLNSIYQNYIAISNAVKTSEYLRNEIAALALYFLHDTIKGCNDCYTDAFIMLSQLKRENLAKIEEHLNCDFVLRRGVVLTCSAEEAKSARIDTTTTRNNITNRSALFHLRKNINILHLFEKYPTDLHDLLLTK